jgi:enamine deaminase RidA (YjgF/YER057c/UK114 family)
LGEPFPAWTAIGCTALAIPGARAEVKATAVITE